MHPCTMRLRSRSLLAALPLTLLGPAALVAQVVVAPLLPVVGTSQPAPIQPPLAKPSTKPCSVTLLNEQAFADFSNKPLTYKPTCTRPLVQVVLSADFTVTAGRQFDRTAKFFLGGANIYFGTTAEPRSTLSPSWHVERDVTDLSVLFKTAQTGQAILGNFIGVSDGVTYNGIIYANARLDFYPADAREPSPRRSDAVLAFPTNDTARVSTTADRSTGTFTFPRNLERLYLDVISQSQSADEFWYTCVPSNVAGELENCGNSAFRETEVSIDVDLPVSPLSTPGSTPVASILIYGDAFTPGFSRRYMAWLERGGVLAIAHVRGGGEFGESWHLAGKKLTKPNTWRDFIASAQYLADHKYTTVRAPRHLEPERRRHPHRPLRHRAPRPLRRSRRRRALLGHAAHRNRPQRSRLTSPSSAAPKPKTASKTSTP